jgi:hypothetical protein
MPVDTSTWTKFGQTSNATFYQVDESTLAVVPFDGCTDDENTATASVDMQLTFLRANKKKAGCIIFMDGITQQTAGARTVYRELPDPEYQVCYALVGGTIFGRAAGSDTNVWNFATGTRMVPPPDEEKLICPSFLKS